MYNHLKGKTKKGVAVVKISTEINSIAKIVGEEKAVEYVAKAGFDAWDFSMFNMARFDWANKKIAESDHPLAGKDYLKFARRLKQIGLDNGIVCNQSHAPHPLYCDEIRGYMERALECTAEAGGKICVIHPNNYKSAEENAEMYFELLPVAKQYGIKIATENMWNWNAETDRAAFAACASHEDFLKHIECINDPDFVACVDLGHAEMMGDMTSAATMIRALGGHVQALHIHDNDQWHDSHALPFTMQMDFDAIVAALKAIGYDGYFTLEAVNHLKGYTQENAFEGVKEMAMAARKLADMFEKA